MGWVKGGGIESGGDERNVVVRISTDLLLRVHAHGQSILMLALPTFSTLARVKKVEISHQLLSLFFIHHI